MLNEKLKDRTGNSPLLDQNVITVSMKIKNVINLNSTILAQRLNPNHHVFIFVKGTFQTSHSAVTIKKKKFTRCLLHDMSATLPGNEKETTKTERLTEIEGSEEGRSENENLAYVQSLCFMLWSL